MTIVDILAFAVIAPLTIGGTFLLPRAWSSSARARRSVFWGSIRVFPVSIVLLWAALIGSPLRFAPQTQLVTWAERGLFVLFTVLFVIWLSIWMFDRPRPQTTSAATALDS